jgi:hypothetical protein
VVYSGFYCRLVLLAGDGGVIVPTKPGNIINLIVRERGSGGIGADEERVLLPRDIKSVHQ